MFGGVRVYSSAVVIALAVFLLGAGSGRGETLTLRNDTSVPLVVQGACIVRGAVRHDRPVLVQPKDVVRVALPGNKLITVYDASVPSRVLCQDTVPAAIQDQFFSIQPVAGLPKVTLQPINP